MAGRRELRVSWSMAAAAVCFVAVVTLDVALSLSPARPQPLRDVVITTVVLLPSVIVGALIWWRVPDSLVGPSLAWLGTSPAVVTTIEDWGSTHVSGHPWPASTAMFVVKQGVWVWNLAGFIALCLVFPDGPLRTARWRRLPWLAAGAALFLNAVVSLDPGSHKVDGRSRAGYALHLPAAARAPELIIAFVGFLAALVLSIASVFVRYRQADETVRTQLRWLMVSAALVPLLLAMGWLAQLAGVPASLWGPGFLLVMLIAVPLSIAIAILRHDLYDLDRLVGSSLTWVVTSVISALIFAGATYGLGTVIGAGSEVSVPTAAFVTALTLLPLHRVLHGRVDRLIDRERAVMFAEVDRFVTWVRDGEVEPEAVEALLRTLLRDDGLRLLLCAPGEDQYVDMQGRLAAPDGPTIVSLHGNQTRVGVLMLSGVGRRARRQAAAVAVRARLPIEMARLRLELRRAVAEVTASRARLLIASTTERRRLERDLHDGAQQQIVSVGMRLRSIQGTLEPDHEVFADLDAAVDALECTVRELRQLAHGVRPSRLNDGLAAGIHDLVATSPIPVDVSVPDLDLPEQTITTIYFVVSEAVTNVWKHARASRVRIIVTCQNGSVAVEVRDDGVGGAAPGFGIMSIRDRVAALGGQVQLVSPAGGGTTVLVTV